MLIVYVASIIRSGINGNKKKNQEPTHGSQGVASIIRSGINGNQR